MKRKTVITAIYIYFLSILGFTQEIVENPVKALDPKAGRVITLEEIQRIEDTGVGFYIKNVNGPIRVSSEGIFFVKDRMDQVLQFDPQGRFVRNLMKKGQGPGELENVHDVLVAGDRVYLAGFPPKVLVYDLEGKLLEEISLKNAGIRFIRILGAESGAIYLYRSTYPNATQDSGQSVRNEEILEVSEGGEKVQNLGSFPVPIQVQDAPGGGRIITGSISLTAVHFKENKFFLSHTPEYLVKLFDTETGKIAREFRRPYARIKQKDQGGMRISGGSAPQLPEYYSDISNLHVVDGRLWVQTSTVDPKKGVLFDVFDAEGRFIDSFYLKYSEMDVDAGSVMKQFAFSGGFVYFSDTTEDGLIMIRKCRLLL